MVDSIWSDGSIKQQITRQGSKWRRDQFSYQPLHNHDISILFKWPRSVGLGLPSYLNYLNLNKISVNLCFLNCPCIWSLLIYAKTYRYHRAILCKLVGITNRKTGQLAPESPFSISKFRNRMKLDMINCLCLFIAVPVLVTKHTETAIWGWDVMWYQSTILSSEQDDPAAVL